MKENTRVDLEPTDDPDVMLVHTNRELSESIEIYRSPEEAANGTPLAALLGSIEGIIGLELNNRDMQISRNPDVAWEDIELQVIEALKDFYLL
jgi:scaffold Nfu/NifU family protein